MHDIRLRSPKRRAKAHCRDDIEEIHEMPDRTDGCWESVQRIESDGGPVVSMNHVAACPECIHEPLDDALRSSASGFAVPIMDHEDTHSNLSVTLPSSL